MPTLASVRRELLRRLGSGVHDLVATSGTTTSITAAADDRIAGGGVTATGRHGNKWVVVLSGDAAGDIRRIANHEETTGVLTIPETPAFRAPVQAGDRVEIWGQLDPRDAVYAIETALRNMRHYAFTPLTLVPDGDMEEPALEGWSQVDGEVGLQKVSARGQVVAGRRALRVVAVRPGGATQSAPFPVEGGVGFTLNVDVRALDGAPASVTVWDVTNGAPITTDAWTGGDWGVVSQGWTAPADCREAAVRLGVVENQATALFDNVQVLRHGQHIYDLPDWIEDARTDLISVVDLRGDRPQQRRAGHAWDVHALVNPTAAAPNQVMFTGDPRGQPWLVAIRPYLDDEARLDADATEIPVNLDWLASNAHVEALRLLMRVQGAENVDDWERLYARRLSHAKRLNRRYQATVPPDRLRVNWDGWRL